MLSDPSSPRRPGVGMTPLIDVVFILLIFFMLVVQFSRYQQVEISTVTSSAATHSQPVSSDEMLVELDPSGACLIRGVPHRCEHALQNMDTTPGQTVMLKYHDETQLIDIIGVKTLLGEAGFTVNLALTPVQGDE